MKHDNDNTNLGRGRPPPIKMPRPTPIAELGVEELKKLYLEASVTWPNNANHYHHHQHQPVSMIKNNLCHDLIIANDLNQTKADVETEDKSGRDMCSISSRLCCRRSTKKCLTLTLALLCFISGVLVVLLAKEVFQTSQDSSKFAMPRHFKDVTDRKDFKVDSVLKDLYITVKTTKKYHHPRLVILLETWVSLVRSQTWFFTDEEDQDMSRRTSNHLVVTNCSNSHSRTALACKMASEFDHFLNSHKSWWCHFDDDNYVHITRLAQLLKAHDPRVPMYLGKPSTSKPLEIFDIRAPQNVSHFWFATGGAGLCLSRTMALKMAPFASHGKFVEAGEKFWFPDDVTMGYIIEHLLGEKLTVVRELHSHLEPMAKIPLEEMDEQITFSYINYNDVANVINLPGPLPPSADPTRFYSLHCLFYNAPYCPS